MIDVVLTADSTLMSNYHGKEFLGFGASAPPNLIPDKLFRLMFFPSGRVKDGVPVEAPYGLRKVEAKLLEEGFNVLTVDPDHLKSYLGEAKVLGVHVMDPFGLGPSSTTFSRILRSGEPYLAKYFRMLFEKPEIKRAKKRGLRIIVGGPRAWQFKYRPGFLDEYGIDCVIDGEAKVVKTAAGIMTDNNLIPACTLIIGLPQETDDDVIKTIELVDGLKDFKSFIVPLFFVPMGKLCDKDWFRMEQLSELQKELMVSCLKHDVYWAKDAMRWYFKEKWYGSVLIRLYRLFIWLVERRARRENIL